MNRWRTFLTGIANSIRYKKETSDPINAENFENEIRTIKTYKEDLKGLTDDTGTTLDIPNGATKIRNYAFYYYKNLVNVIIPESIIEIGEKAFYYCNNLKNIYYKGKIEDWCKISIYDEMSTPLSASDHFYMLNEENEYYEVTEIEIPDTITQIGNYQFHGFYYVTSIIIPDSVTSIGTNAFHYCGSLTSIIIPDSVTSIGSYAFRNCNRLASVSLPNNLININSYTFIYSGLKSITIPESVTNIGYYAFFNCSKLSTIKMLSTIPPTLDSKAFESRFVYKIIVPVGTLATYQSATNWSTYADKMEEATE